MNDEQYKRYRKLHSETIECLFRTHDSNKTIYFLVSGSTGTKYKVTIPKNGRIECSCPDFKTNCKTHHCVCKHCLYVIYDNLKLFKDIDHGFFKRCYFTPDEIHTVHSIYKQHLRSSSSRSSSSKSTLKKS